jgi:hypothetical protein
MNLKDWKKRNNELEKYKDTVNDTVLAAKSNYAVQGGVNYQIIVKAITRVFDELGERYLKFIKSEEFLNSKEEQEAYKQNPAETLIAFSTHILIELLKENGYLREKLGKTEENKLYDDFYVYDDNGNLFPNLRSILSLCLNHVHIKHANMDKYKDIPLLSKEIKPIRTIPIKRGVYRSRFGKPIDKKIKAKIEINEREFLNRKLASGQTFEQLFQAAQREYIRKSADDLIFEIKLIALAQKILKGTHPSIICPNQHKMAKARLTLKDICENFLKRDKTGRYPTYDKRKILKKLWVGQNNLISLVEMRGNEPILVSHKLYEFDEILLPNKSEYFISIDTSPIDFYYENFLYMDLDELEKIGNYIDEYWEKISKDNPEILKKVERILPNQICRAAPLKFNILLKYRCHRGNGFENKKTGYRGNCCRISDEKLNIGLGDIYSEIDSVLQNSHYVRMCEKRKGLSETAKLSRECILGCTFYCANKLKWISSFPKYDSKKQVWNFNLNVSYFDKNAKLANLKTLMGK